MNVLEIQIIDPRVMPIFRAMEHRGWILMKPAPIDVFHDEHKVAEMTESEFKTYIAGLIEALN